MSPLINTDGNRWTNTCPNCHWVPDKELIIHEEGHEWVWPPIDYVTTHRISKRTGELGKRSLNLPDRCKACAAKYRRKLRMRARIKKLVDLLDFLPKKYRIPKLLTFGLPVWTSEHYEDRFDLISDLNDKRKQINKILKDNDVLGSIFPVFFFD